MEPLKKNFVKKRGKTFFLSLIILSLVLNLASAEKLKIDIRNNFLQNQEIDFRITLYDDNDNKLIDKIDYKIKNYYADVIKEGKAISGEWFKFRVPDNAEPGVWEITALYKGKEINEKFSIGELKKINITLEGDTLIIKNVGNTDYEGYILIYIGDKDQTLNIYLARGQTKKVRLTAPPGKYTVRVDDGSGKGMLVFKNVALTGNVIGLERVIEGNFFQRYPLVSLFLIAVFLAIVIVAGLRIFKKPKKN